MPYTKDEAVINSELYDRIINEERIALNREIETNRELMKISGSWDATNPLRDGNGIILSYEDPDNLGNAVEEVYQHVRVINQQQYFNDDMLPEIDKEREFSEFIIDNFNNFYSATDGKKKQPRPGGEVSFNPPPNLPEPDEEPNGEVDNTFGTPEAPSGYQPRIPFKDNFDLEE
tara:strand:- start:351 stop:872 length:522 start_codon:yes stop_codon:yes gene_type:complete